LFFIAPLTRDARTKDRGIEIVREEREGERERARERVCEKRVRGGRGKERESVGVGRRERERKRAYDARIEELLFDKVCMTK